MEYCVPLKKKMVTNSLKRTVTSYLSERSWNNNINHKTPFSKITLAYLGHGVILLRKSSTARVIPLTISALPIPFQSTVKF